MASLESSLLRGGKGSWNLSENHLAAHQIGILWGFDDGGNNQVATAILTAWRDPVLEELDPYPNPQSTVQPPTAFHVQNVIWLPERGVDDNAYVDGLMKSAVMDYGAVSVCYYHASNCYDSSRGTYRFSYDMYDPYDSYSGGHAVTLVGWDDNYPSNNFIAPPPGNGAFLCKNSWGESDGNKGYIWISYYDELFAYMPSAAFPVPESTNNYGRVYEYDLCGQTGSWNVYLDAMDESRGGKENWGANMFTAVATGIVEAVGFYSLAAGTTYELKVYNHCAGTPASGTLVSSQSGTLPHSGYVTLPLATPVPIVAGFEKFAVVLHLETPGYDYPLPVACDSEEEGELFSTNVAHVGESFLSSNGVDWVDFQQYPGATRTENLCIKAYTRYGADGEVAERLIAAFEPVDDRLTLSAGSSANFSVTGNGEGVAMEWLLDGAVMATGDSFALTVLPADHGVHELVCRASRGSVVEQRSWTVAVTSRLYVDAASSSSAPNGTPTDPFPSINAALATAMPGDEISVAPGVYAECVVPYVALPIRSQTGPADTIIDGESLDCCYDGSYAPEAQLSGFTLKNGAAAIGGGAYAGVLDNCVITSCMAYEGGGAFDCVLINCLITTNDAYETCDKFGQYMYGEGAGAAYCLMTNCLVTDCIADYAGGGAYECDLVNCTLAGNAAYGFGGGAYLQIYGFAANTVVAENICARGADYGNDVYGNAYWYMIASISDQDARFVDSEHGDFRLRADSPAVDAGDNSEILEAVDLEGRQRIVGARVDMGAFERPFELLEGWPDPKVAKNDSPTVERGKVTAAMEMAGFAAETAASVSKLADYAAIMEWAGEHSVAKAQFAAARAPLIVAALNAPELVDITDEDARIAALTDDGAWWKLVLNLPNYDVAKVNQSLLRSAVEVKGTAALDKPMTGDGLSAEVVPGIDNVEVWAMPPASTTNYFFKTIIK